MHGGAAPQVAAVREGRILAARSRLAHDTGADLDPHGALLAALSDADAVLQGIKATWSAGPSATALQALGQWIDRTARLAGLAVSSQIAERVERLTQVQAAVVAEVIRGVLADLELDERQRAAVPAVVSRWLRAASEGTLPEVSR